MIARELSGNDMRKESFEYYHPRGEWRLVSGFIVMITHKKNGNVLVRTNNWGNTPQVELRSDCQVRFGFGVEE